jgi:MerR family mercuric resistance operon transcriptional regulator
MNACTVSRLALDAGVSVHIVRDYLLRGLLRPVACTPGGYGLFDDAALQRLCFVRAAFEAGIGLDALARQRSRCRSERLRLATVRLRYTLTGRQDRPPCNVRIELAFAFIDTCGERS